jgi:hypothetical protein
VAYLSTTIIVLSPNLMFPLAIQSSDLFHSGLSERKHSDLTFYLTYQSISIDIEYFRYSINTNY